MTRPRHLTAPLLVAILGVPAIFGWLLLRRGDARSTRLAALAYGGAITVVGVVGRTFG